MNRYNLFTATSFTLLAAAVHAVQAPGIGSVGPTAVRIHAVPSARDTWVGVPEGTRLRVRLESPLSTRDARVGDAFVARVGRTVMVDGQAPIPAGATVVGHVIECDRPKAGRDPHRLQLRFDALEIDGERYAIASRGMPYEAQPRTRVRGGTMTATRLATPSWVPIDAGWTAPGTDITFPRGTLLEFRLDRSIRVRMTRS